MNLAGAMAGVIVGGSTVLIWIYVPFSVLDGQALSSVIYEIVPGFLASSLAIVLVSLATKPPTATTSELFHAMSRHLFSRTQ